MAIVGAVIVPHPPIILPEVGGGREREISKTSGTYYAAMKRLASWEPDAVVILSPHTILYADYFHISPGEGASGDMASFGVPRLKLEVRYDTVLRERIISQVERAGLPAGTMGEREASLDHGTFILLYFMEKAGLSCPIIRCGLSGLSPLEHYELGRCIKAAAEADGKRIAIVASGDLSHKLKEDGPYGLAPEGPEFDVQVTEAMGKGDFLSFLTFDADFCQRAAECGLKAFQVMAGALDGLAVSPELLSYEGTFGVGYGVAVFEVAGKDEGRCFADRYEALEQERLRETKEQEDPWVQLARLSLETYVGSGKRLKELPSDLPEELRQQAAGVFVSLHEHGQLRGCIGTTEPVTASVADEIVRNAVFAGAEDPRFPAVTASELGSLEYKVDVLGAPEAIDGPEQLDVRRYGVIVSCGHRRGLLLPDLDGIDTVQQQIDIARQKGGIGAEEAYSLERFEVVRHR
ncbi:MAG: AmmeMemoRadiSam system protein A [Bacillota bacterium]|nr:AmmeMemoRadiSam system protein A [Bacillota bacterium]